MAPIKDTPSDSVQNKSVLDKYSNKVFQLVVLIVSIFFLCGKPMQEIQCNVHMRTACGQL